MALTTGSGSGPARVTASASEGPGTYSVASQGVRLLASPPRNAAVRGLRTAAAAAISRRNRTRNPSSRSSSSRTVFSATSAPAGIPDGRARYTSPMPPVPSRPRMR